MLGCVGDAERLECKRCILTYLRTRIVVIVVSFEREYRIWPWHAKADVSGSWPGTSQVTCPRDCDEIDGEPAIASPSSYRLTGIHKVS